jgi:hypothetical protein
MSTLEVELALSLAAVLGFIGGMGVCAGSMQRLQNSADRDIEKAAVWRIEDRAYRLVRTPGLDDITHARSAG